jgi:two-component system sensor histidine kinase KdpD
LQAEARSKQLRNVLLSSLSHDLRTPLTVINGSISTLLKMRRKLPREAVDELTRLWKHLARLQNFTGNLLRMAAITSGPLKLNREPYMIQEIVGAALGHIGPEREARRIRTAVNGTVPMVMVDGALIGQVLVNLIENAVAHTEEGGTIAITVGRRGEWVEVTVRDDGPGLSPGMEDRIFNRFDTGDRKGGTGLGLAISKAIVEAHGGSIRASNNENERGARFTILLPEAKVDISEDGEPR